MELPNGLGFLYRPVLAQICPPGAPDDARYSLEDFAEWNDVLDVVQENERRSARAERV